MQYTDNEAALIGGLISTYFFQPAVSASLKAAYHRVFDAPVSVQPTNTAGAHGCQYEDNRAAEYIASLSPLIHMAEKVRLSVVLFLF